VLTLFLSDNAVNPGESLTAHGRASWQPGNSPVVGENVEVSLDGSPLENLATDENGEYSLTLSSTVLGLHTVRVSLTDNQGTREENELTFKVETLTLTVSLNDYVVNPDQSLTVSGRVRRVWENVPETSATVSVYIDDQIAGEGGTNQSGDYSVAVKAPSSLGPHQLRVRAVNTEGITGENRTSFTVKTLSVSLSLTDTAGNPRSEANPGEALRISGTVRLQPEGFPVTLNPIDLFLDNVLIRTDNTDLWGSYRFDVTAPEEIGTYEYRVRITGPEGITGENFALLTVRRIDISMAYDDGVVNPGQVNRVSGRAVLQPGNQPVQFSKVSFSLFDENGSWSGGAENYTDANGNYSITFASPSRIGTYYGKASTTVGVFWSENVKELYVKTVRLSLTFDDNIVTLTQNFTMSGEAVLLPDNVPVRNTAVEIKVDGFPETTVYTDENGRYSYLYTKDAPAPSKHTVQVRLQNPEGIVGENTGYFEQRVVTFEWFGTLDSHGQFDGVLNPGENFYLAVRILENNGSEVFPVTMGSATVKVDGATPSPPGLTHVTSGYWRTYASYTAPSSLGTYVRYLDVSILTANGISGYVYGQPAPYQVKALRLPVLLSDRVVNPGGERDGERHPHPPPGGYARGERERDPHLRGAGVRPARLLHRELLPHPRRPGPDREGEREGEGDGPQGAGGGELHHPHRGDPLDLSDPAGGGGPRGRSLRLQRKGPLPPRPHSGLPHQPAGLRLGAAREERPDPGQRRLLLHLHLPEARPLRGEGERGGRGGAEG